ncbi:MAG: hypothetical protein CMQ41_13485 [Gammaproteobacteria bacterium]|nr:hypothetical protein [Gammaproteobacteria bacterium]
MSKNIDINVLIQLVGMLGVIASLIFVGLQMRQTQQIALAAQAQARTEMLLTRHMTFLEGRSELGYRAFATPYAELTPEERWVRDLHSSWLRDLQQNNYFQYRLGFLNEEQWQVIQARIAQVWSNCDLRSGYYAEDFMEAAFIDYLMALDDPCN